MAYNLMWTQAGDPKILNLTDDRLGHLCIIHDDRIDEWIEEYLKWYRNDVEEQETEGSGFVYAGWIGFHIEMFPLRTFIGHKHPTPFVIGRTVINPNIDDNRCLQRCLILASEGGHKIVANRKIGDTTVYKSFDFSELDNTSYFYGQLVKYYYHEVDKSKFPSLESFLNFNKKLSDPIFKDEHNGHRITEFVGLRPKMYCLVDEKHVVHNAAKGVPRNVVIDGERMSVKNIDLYKRVLEAEKKGDAVMEGSFKRINNEAFNISTKEQTKTLKTCMDNKRWILDDNVHTLAFGHYRLKDK